MFGRAVLGASLLVAAIAVTVRVARPRARDDSPLQVHWHSRGLLLADLDGDGTQDVIGESRRVNRTTDDVRVIAIDGRTGRPRWESPSIGTYTQTDEGLLAITGDLVLFSTRTELEAFAVADGSRRWKVELPGRIVRLCDPGDGTIVAAASSEVARAIRKRDGEILSGDEGGACIPVRTEARVRPHREVLGMAVFGIVTDAFFDGPPDGPVTRVLAGRSNQVNGHSRGSGIATLVAIGPAGQQRWRAEMPDEPAPMAKAPEHVVVGSQAVCAVYALQHRSQLEGIACFAAEDGQRMWSGALPWGTTALEISGRTLLISRSGFALEARDLDTGATRWAFGE